MKKVTQSATARRILLPAFRTLSTLGSQRLGQVVFGGLAEASKARRRPHHMQGHLLFPQLCESFPPPDRARGARSFKRSAEAPQQAGRMSRPLSRRIVGAPIESIETPMLGGQSVVGGLYP